MTPTPESIKELARVLRWLADRLDPPPGEAAGGQVTLKNRKEPEDG